MPLGQSKAMWQCKTCALYIASGATWWSTLDFSSLRTQFLGPLCLWQCFTNWMMLWPVTVTPGDTHFGAYYRPPGGHCSLFLLQILDIYCACYSYSGSHMIQFARQQKNCQQRHCKNIATYFFTLTGHQQKTIFKTVFNGTLFLKLLFLNFDKSKYFLSNHTN